MLKWLFKSAPAPILSPSRGTELMFKKIMHANDGSDHAFKVLALAMRIAKQNNAELHMVCVEEIPYMPEYTEEVRQERATAGRRFHAVLQRARAMAEAQQLRLEPHILAGHPVRDIVTLAADLETDLLVIGATGIPAVRAHDWEPR
jgi:nucleotide-binding universal stress UspA family protein